jgi:membrane protein insertase Oxa1/YidC/SpoIIIJ
MTLIFAVLLTALLFGGMALFSFGFAAVLFHALPPAAARTVLRKTFPWFYLFVIIAAAGAAVLWWPHDSTSAGWMLGVALTTLVARQVLMPAINRATDAGQRQRFQWLHGLSVLVTLVHIGGCGWLLAHLA